jgi:hypothetical protein
MAFLSIVFYIIHLYYFGVLQPYRPDISKSATPVGEPSLIGGPYVVKSSSVKGGPAGEEGEYCGKLYKYAD